MNLRNILGILFVDKWWIYELVNETFSKNRPNVTNNFEVIKNSFDKYFLSTYVPGTVLGTKMSIAFI